jgi:hypothetical protein
LRFKLNQVHGADFSPPQNSRNNPKHEYALPRLDRLYLENFPATKTRKILDQFL